MIKKTLLKMIPKPWEVLLRPFRDETYTTICIQLGFILSSVMFTLSQFIENVFGINSFLFIAIVVTNIFDFIVGLYAAKRNREVICYVKGVRTLIKLGAYLVFLFIINALRKQDEILPGMEGIVKFLHYYISFHILIWESKSINEKLLKLNVDLGLSGLFKTLWKKVSKSSESLK